MWHMRVVLVLGVAIGCSHGYYLFPGIFDPNPYIPKMSPDVLKVTSSPYRGPLITSYSGGGDDKDGEIGFVKSTSESGSGGYRHKESFHTKDGNDYEHERQEGYGESKGEELDHGSDKKLESKRKNDESDGHSREEAEEDRNYEVTEEDNNDHQNPHQHTTYGVAPTKQKKKKTQPLPEFGTRLTLPKKTSHKKNHNGYETVIYHDNEQKGFEKGYGRRHGHNQPPTSVVVVRKGDDEEEPREKDPREDEHEDEEEDLREDYDDEKKDHDHQDDQDREEYDENYNGYKYGNDFAKNYYDDEERDQESDDRRNERRDSARDEGPEYDDEVDKEQIDETANEDKYYGDEYDDDDYRRRHQYEYASEADYDAQ